MDSQEPLESTIDLAAACSEFWDVIVVGGGPSGALSARQIALAGASVLLVDKATFPRRKVCGCYLNGSALATLSRVGLEPLLRDLEAPVVHRVLLGARGRVAELKLPDGAAVSREALDTSLIRAAIDAGAQFLSGVEAKWQSADQQQCISNLKSSVGRGSVRAKVTVVADGVGGHFFHDSDDLNYRTAPESLVGVAAVTERLPEAYLSGTIQMAVGDSGYVGCLQLENGQLDIAAALAPSRLRDASGPGELAQFVVEQSGLPSLGDLASLRWIGTPPLTRKPTTRAAQRVFLIGDAAGYVEPFTGEGISWALATGQAVAPMAVEASNHYSRDMIDHWNSSHRRLLGRRQRFCHWLTRSLRKPRLAQFGVSALSRFPFLAGPIVRLLNTAP